MVKIQKRQLTRNELVALNFIILGISLINEGLVRQSLLYLLCGKCPCYSKEIRRAQSQNLNLKLCALSIYYI